MISWDLIWASLKLLCLKNLLTSDYVGKMGTNVFFKFDNICYIIIWDGWAEKEEKNKEEEQHQTVIKVTPITIRGGEKKEWKVEGDRHCGDKNN